MSFGGMGMQAFGAGYKAVGAYNQAATQKGVLNYQAQVAQNNATVANMQASQEQLIGQQQEQTQRLQGAQVYGAQRAAMAANGVDLGEGSASNVLTTTDYMNERDALTIRDNAMRRAWGYQVQAQNMDNEASVDRSMGSSINPAMSAAGSLLTSAGSVYKGYKQYQWATKGAPSGSDSGNKSFWNW